VYNSIVIDNIIYAVVGIQILDFLFIYLKSEILLIRLFDKKKTIIIMQLKSI